VAALTPALMAAVAPVSRPRTMENLEGFELGVRLD